jgi:hypothetical protein
VSLAGTNLTQTQLPEKIGEFEMLDHIAEISKTARGTFLAMIGGCFYCWLAIATTALENVKVDATLRLPIINTDIPVMGFFVIAPLILLAIYVYLHMYLIRLWSGLGTLPAFFQDGRSLDEKVYPWLLSSMVRLFVPLLTTNRPSLWWLQVGMSMILAWLLVPITELAFLSRVWKIKDILSIATTAFSLLSSLFVLVATFDIARNELSGSEKPLILSRVGARFGFSRRKEQPPADETT